MSAQASQRPFSRDADSEGILAGCVTMSISEQCPLLRDSTSRLVQAKMDMGASPHARPLGLQGAFSLVELLVAMAILSVLAGLFLPTLERSIDMARAVSCANNVRIIGNGIHLYAAGAKDYFPTMDRSPVNSAWVTVPMFAKIYEAYSGDNQANMYRARPEEFRCPAWGGAWPNTFPENITFANTSPYALNYYFYAGSSRQPQVRRRLGCAKYPAQCILYGDKLGRCVYSFMLWGDGFTTYGMLGVRHGGCANAYFVDGHVSLERSTDWVDPTAMPVESEDGSWSSTIPGTSTWITIGSTYKHIRRFWGMDVSITYPTWDFYAAN